MFDHPQYEHASFLKLREWKVVGMMDGVKDVVTLNLVREHTKRAVSCQSIALGSFFDRRFLARAFGNTTAFSWYAVTAPVVFASVGVSVLDSLVWLRSAWLWVVLALVLRLELALKLR